MKRSHLWLLAGVALAVVGAGQLSSWTSSWREGGGALGLFLVACLLGSLDLVDLVVRLVMRRTRTHVAGGSGSLPTSMRLDIGHFTPHQVKCHIRPYAIVASVHNAEDKLDDFLEAIEPYREHVWVIDDASTDDTPLRLTQAGIRCIVSPTNRKKPGALRELLAHLDPSIQTVVVVDPDCRILNRSTTRGAPSDLEQVIFELQRSGIAAVCPRITVRGETLLGRFQQLEYALSFSLGRKSLLDHSITSGIAIYRRDALAWVLDHHTLSVYAEDLKNSLLLLAKGERIYYDGRLVVETEGKRTWDAWFSQRVGWYFGMIKVYAESLGSVWRFSKRDTYLAYQHLVYNVVFSLALHPAKLVAFGVLMASLAGGISDLLGVPILPRFALLEPVYFLVAYFQFVVVVSIAVLASVERGERRRLLSIVPYHFAYVMLHLVPMTIGYLNWIGLRFWGRRVYRDHFQDDLSLRNELLART